MARTGKRPIRCGHITATIAEPDAVTMSAPSPIEVMAETFDRVRSETALPPGSPLANLPSDIVLEALQKFYADPAVSQTQAKQPARPLRWVFDLANRFLPTLAAPLRVPTMANALIIAEAYRNDTGRPPAPELPEKNRDVAEQILRLLKDWSVERDRQLAVRVNGTEKPPRQSKP